MVNNFSVSRSDRVLKAVQANTEENLRSDKENKDWIHAGAVAEQLGIDRTNVSRELNRLYKDGQLIKVQGKPTLYISRSVLEKKFPDVFFPSTLPKDASLKEYVKSEKNMTTRVVPAPAATDLECQVGSDGTLRNVVQQAKAAVLYPPHGLNVLITGHVGVGKLLLAKKMYAHGIAKGRLAEGAPFITVNCREYPGSPQTFLNQLFGFSGTSGRNDKVRRGLIERASGGILCLLGVERLSQFIQDNLFDLLERGTYTRVGEASAVRKANVMVIAIADELPDAPSIQGLQQRVPIRIQIPDLDEWTMPEILELVIQDFEKEAVSTGLSFQVSSDTLSCFLKSSYPGNLGGLSSAVRTTCSLAYLDDPVTRLTTVRIDHLPVGFMQDIHTNPERDMELMRLLRKLNLETITFTPAGFFAGTDPGPAFLEKLHRINRGFCIRSDVPEDAPGKVPIIILSYGNQIAERAAEFINTALDTDIVTGLSYGPDMNMAEYTEKLCKTASEVNKNRGVLLVADMEPLTSLHIPLRHYTGIPAMTFTHGTVPILMLAAQLSLQRKYDLQGLLRELTQIQLGKPQDKENAFIDRIVDEVLTPLLSFINPRKVADVLTVTLENITKALGIEQTDVLTIKFIFHCSHMLERLIRGDSLRYDKLKAFINQNSALFSILEKEMQYVAEVFGISIPASELAYVAEIFIPDTEDSVP